MAKTKKKNLATWKETLRFIGLLWETMATGASETAARLALARRHIRESNFHLYVRSFRRLALAMIITPIPMLILGITGFGKDLIVVAALFWIAATVAAWFVAAPLGILLEILTQGFRGIGARYAALLKWTLLIEASIALILRFLPIYNNRGNVTLLLLGGAVLGFVGWQRGKGEKFLRTMTAVGILAISWAVFSFFFPKTHAAISDEKGLWMTADTTMEASTRTFADSNTSSEAPGNTGKYRPDCIGEKNISLEPKHELLKVQLKSAECWGGQIKTHLGTSWSFTSDKPFGVLFVEGDDYWFDDPKGAEVSNFGVRSGAFKFRGAGTVWVEQKPLPELLELINASEPEEHEDPCEDADEALYSVPPTGTNRLRFRDVDCMRMRPPEGKILEVEVERGNWHVKADDFEDYTYVIPGEPFQVTEEALLYGQGEAEVRVRNRE